MTALRFTVRGLALVPIVTGLASVVLGSEIIGGGERTHPNVESELRFYAAFWVGLGVYLFSLAGRIEERGRELRFVCALLVLGAAGRAIAMLDGARPDALYVVLMAIEFAIPLILVPWQSRLRGAASARATAAARP